ncbi:hypothetical protein F0M18_10250 [Pseudohalioglobus sediminis]|uniref:DUF5672 domain-containing protein n=1 Tax=Pseudohalioglobus sediminis TaxID=2606449 RepID=A0A5B0X1B0_9GAMM|nr:hypothetical protein [Pseudohalioglobus sediminis]KAA1191899.1 hypothetical protein F0M18_10250 [Pseudohalioglobus sediminis]
MNKAFPTSLPPIAISYRPKEHDYLPVVVGAIRHHLGDWPVVLLTETSQLPPAPWLKQNAIHTITDWSHSERANKILRLWEHQEIFARHFPAWIWWHDDMLLLRPLADPVSTFETPLIRHRQRKRPNEKLSNWDNWLWETLSFFRCQNIYAPNPVLHTPRVIRRESLERIPETWNRKRLLFEPTYLLRQWHDAGIRPELATGFRKSVFSGSLPALESLREEGFTILNWGRGIDHAAARSEFGRHYPVDFSN